MKISLDIIKRVASRCATRFLLFFIFSCTSVITNAETAPLVSRPATTQSHIKHVSAHEPKTKSAGTVSIEKPTPDKNLAVVTSLSQANSTHTTIPEDKNFASILAIAQTGALHLALMNLDKQQPAYEKDHERWLNWERERITLLKLSGQNAILVKRLSGLPEGLPSSFLYWAKTQQAIAYLGLQEYSKVREILNQLIWTGREQDLEFFDKWLPQWRRIIILSYLNQGLLKDAHISNTRFRQDYGQGDISDVILYARVLLMNNLADEALNSLSGFTDNPEAGMLHLLAQLRKETRSPQKILQASLRQMQGAWVQPELKIYLWSIVAEAAQSSEDKLTGIKAMEFILADENRELLPKGLFNLGVDDLWNAYVENAIKIGNKAQYLMGDDPVWLKAAQAEQETQPVNTRSLCALLILRGQDSKTKEQAIRLFLESVSKTEKGNELVNQLFLNSRKFKLKESVPVMVRHFMVDDAIDKNNIRLASDLISSIKTSPQGADKFMWSLRRARVLVMGGKTEHSANALIQMMTESEHMPIVDLDKLIQVVFDLQTVNAHQQAYAVFEKVVHLVEDIQRQREIYYWMADSKKALKQYAEAADLYLKSAMLAKANSTSINADVGLDASLDPWGQTARYQAAHNLAKAGLVDDARALYTHLLKVTKEESRIKLLKHELQQLWLLENQKSKNIKH